MYMSVYTHIYIYILYIYICIHMYVPLYCLRSARTRLRASTSRPKSSELLACRERQDPMSKVGPACVYLDMYMIGICIDVCVISGWTRS